MDLRKTSSRGNNEGLRDSNTDVGKTRRKRSG